jgi:hypothetical protein
MATTSLTPKNIIQFLSLESTATISWEAGAMEFPEFKKVDIESCKICTFFGQTKMGNFELNTDNLRTEGEKKEKENELGFCSNLSCKLHFFQKKY